MNIAVIGLGYVGLSLACLLAKNNDVRTLDVLTKKVEALNQGLSPINDTEIEAFLKTESCRLTATTDPEKALKDSDFIIIATSTDTGGANGWLNTASIEQAVGQVSVFAPKACIVIKSTVPVGYTEELSGRYPDISFLFSPEFLREGKALYDNLHPSRIVVGYPPAKSALLEKAECFAQLLADGADENVDDIDKLICSSTEAEAIKLFANAYLALRVAYINELDTFAELKGLDPAKIIKGIGLDPRIGTHYNNPSFGYGGYCLPKDSKQLLASYGDMPQELIRAVVESNDTRIVHIVEQIATRKPDVVGIYRLVMKKGSDNFRQSAVIAILEQLIERGIRVVVFEPLLGDETWKDCEVVRDLEEFKQLSELIVCNRLHDDLADVANKVYTRDLWHTN